MKLKYALKLTKLAEEHYKNIPFALAGLKGALVIELRKKKMLQTEIAKKLGITQASVSFYLKRIRGGASPLIENNAELKKEIEKLAGEI